MLNRHSFEQVYVAIDGPKKLTIESGYHAIVGYAIVKHGRILELMTDGSREDIVPDLLERICSDVIEQKDVPVRLDAPDGDPLHELMINAGGEFLRRTVVGGEVILSKVFNPLTLLKQVRHLLNDRAQQAKVSLPTSLGSRCSALRRRCPSRTPRGRRRTTMRRTTRHHRSHIRQTWPTRCRTQHILHRQPRDSLLGAA